jgi:uncharacterized protein YdaU (DUF1376 family)
MNGLPYYKAYPRDFIEGTIGMPGEMKCAYRLLLDLIYMQGGRLANDDKYISGLLGYSTRKWRTIRQYLIDSKKIRIEGQFITNVRVSAEIADVKEWQNIQSQNASGKKKKVEPEPEAPKETEAPKDEPPKPAKLPKPRATQDCDRFDEFWAIVPKKVAKGAARRAYKAAVKKVSQQAIIEGMERYAAQRSGRDPSFTAHASTWLNGERWADSPINYEMMNTVRNRPHDSKQFDNAHDEYVRRIAAGEIDPGSNDSNPFSGG